MRNNKQLHIIETTLIKFISAVKNISGVHVVAMAILVELAKFWPNFSFSNVPMRESKVMRLKESHFKFVNKCFAKSFEFSYTPCINVAITQLKKSKRRLYSLLGMDYQADHAFRINLDSGKDAFVNLFSSVIAYLLKNIISNRNVQDYIQFLSCLDTVAKRADFNSITDVLHLEIGWKSRKTSHILIAKGTFDTLTCIVSAPAVLDSVQGMPLVENADDVRDTCLAEATVTVQAETRSNVTTENPALDMAEASATDQIEATSTEQAETPVAATNAVQAEDAKAKEKEDGGLLEEAIEDLRQVSLLLATDAPLQAGSETSLQSIQIEDKKMPLELHENGEINTMAVIEAPSQSQRNATPMAKAEEDHSLSPAGAPCLPQHDMTSMSSADNPGMTQSPLYPMTNSEESDLPQHDMTSMSNADNPDLPQLPLYSMTSSEESGLTQHPMDPLPSVHELRLPQHGLTPLPSASATNQSQQGKMLLPPAEALNRSQATLPATIFTPPESCSFKPVTITSYVLNFDGLPFNSHHNWTEVDFQQLQECSSESFVIASEDTTGISSKIKVPFFSKYGKRYGLVPFGFLSNSAYTELKLRRMENPDDWILVLARLYCEGHTTPVETAYAWKVLEYARKHPEASDALLGKPRNSYPWIYRPLGRLRSISELTEEPNQIHPASVPEHVTATRPAPQTGSATRCDSIPQERGVLSSATQLQAQAQAARQKAGQPSGSVSAQQPAQHAQGMFARFLGSIGALFTSRTSHI